MCYADYLCETNERLFMDQIYAYKYGPIIKTVYEAYKKGNKKEIVEDDEIIFDEEKWLYEVELYHLKKA